MKKIIINQKVLANLFLGFSSGLPLVLIGQTLQAWFTVAGADLAVIGMLSLVGQPYVYKFVWAPIMDRVLPPFLGRRRGWIALMQLFLIVALFAMAFMNPVESPWLLACLALSVAFFSASQDIAIDAYRADLLNETERGIGAAMATIGYRVAMLVAGGVALALADKMGWRFTYLVMAGLMLLGLLVTLKAPTPKDYYRPHSLLAAVLDPLKNFLSRPAAWLLVLFMILYNLGNAFILSLNTAFLLRGLEFSLTEVGLWYKTVGLLATLLGSLIGGIALTRYSLFRCLLVFGILQASANLGYMLLAVVGKNYPLMVGSIFIENFCAGLAMVAFVALLMSWCDKRYTATQYALFSALGAVGRVYVGPLAGALVNYLSWPQFFFCGFILALPAIFLLLLIKKHIISPQSLQASPLVMDDTGEVCV